MELKVEIRILGQCRINKLLDFNQQLNLNDNREYDLDTAASILLGTVLNDNPAEKYLPNKQSVDEEDL